MVMDWVTGGIAAANGALTAIKWVRDLVKADKSIDTEGRLRLLELLGDLQDEVQAGRDALQALFREKTALEEENRRLRQFQVDRENYVLQSIGPNAFAYTRKPGAGAQEPAPYLCAHCFDRAEVSYLQFQCHDISTDALVCKSCGAEVHQKRQENWTASVVPRDRDFSIW